MILVTGASGFLGQHLVRHLSAQGSQVRALYYTQPPGGEKNLPGVEWVQADLLDIYDVERVTRDISEVFHCAAIVSFHPQDRERMLHFNPESTANIVNAAMEAGIRKMVYVSSVSALSKTGDRNKLITEEQEWDDNKYNSAYGLSKYLAEMEVWRGIGEGLNAVIINPGIILGAGDWDKGSPKLMKIAHSEFPFYTKGIASWTDVDDVVKAMAMLMESGIESERFIVSSGNFSYREIFTMMANALNKKPPRFHANKLMSAVLWRGGSIFLGKKMLITRETARSAHGYALYDNSKLLKAFPAFSYVPIATTIEKMARYFINSL